MRTGALPGGQRRGGSFQRRSRLGWLSPACPGPLGWQAPGEQRGQAGSRASRLPADLCGAERSIGFAFMQCHITKSPHR